MEQPPAGLGELDQTEVVTEGKPLTEHHNPPVGPDAEENEITEAEQEGEDSLPMSQTSRLARHSPKREARVEARGLDDCA